jgi:hypothetical protein
VTVSENPTDEHVADLLERLSITVAWGETSHQLDYKFYWNDFFEQLDPMNCRAAMAVLDMAS